MAGLLTEQPKPQEPVSTPLGGMFDSVLGTFLPSREQLAQNYQQASNISDFIKSRYQAALGFGQQVLNPDTWAHWPDLNDPQVREDIHNRAMNLAMNWNPAAIASVGGKISDMTYRISHRPMVEAGGAARLDDLTKSFPEDIYGPNALQYYGSGDIREAAVLKKIQSLRGKPNEMVTIYRGVPNVAPSEINAGDWVTLDPNVAADYGEKVINKQVPASHITSWADSLLEFGYHPPKK